MPLKQIILIKAEAGYVRPLHHMGLTPPCSPQLATHNSRFLLRPQGPAAGLAFFMFLGIVRPHLRLNLNLNFKGFGAKFNF